jgi:Ca-activated chloride channel homolog
MITKAFRNNGYMAYLFLLIFSITLNTLTTNTFAQSNEPPSSGKLLLILDASGSMWGQIGGENKIAIAKKVLTELVDELPEDTEVGLIAYGHRQKGDCKDIETIVEIAPLDKAALNEKIEALNPKGKTPITDSVLMAFESVRATEDAVTVILVSDGIETCGGDPCRAVREAKEAGINFIMHVVGFDVGDVDVSQLECAAQAGGGLYLSAQNASELTEALETAVDMHAELPIGKLSVKVTAEGKLKDSFIKLTNTQTDEQLKAQRTYASPETNPRIISLPYGIYDLEVSPIGMKGVKGRTIKGIEIKEDTVVEKEVDFSFGELSVKVVRNGKLSDAAVYIYEPETETTVAKGRTYTSSNSNPKVFELAPGVYDVEIKALEVEGSPTEKFNAVEILSGETVEQLVDFSSGTLKAGALKGEKYVDATVYITDTKSGGRVAQGRTYTGSKSNPRVFELTPGVYDVEIKALNIEGTPSEKFEAVEVKASEAVERTAQFSSGVLKAGAREGEKFVDASVYIKDTKTGERVAQGRTYKSSKTNPKVFELTPGVYDVEIKALNIEGSQPEKFEAVEIKASETVEKTAKFSSGVLKVGAREGEKLVDAAVYITDSRTGERIAQGRTYTKATSNPKEFILIPGSYSVTLKALKIEGNPEETFEVEVKAQEELERITDFTK